MNKSGSGRKNKFKVFFFGSKYFSVFDYSRNNDIEINLFLLIRVDIRTANSTVLHVLAALESLRFCLVFVNFVIVKKKKM